jgi:hypothetical protein
MGIMRKLTSASTLGAVKYTSRREAQTKAAAAQGRAADQEAKLLKAQRKATPKAQPAASQQWDEVLAAITAGEASYADLSRLQKLSMPIGYQLRCKAASRRQNGQLDRHPSRNSTAQHPGGKAS